MLRPRPSSAPPPAILSVSPLVCSFNQPVKEIRCPRSRLPVCGLLPVSRHPHACARKSSAQTSEWPADCDGLPAAADLVGAGASRRRQTARRGVRHCACRTRHGKGRLNQDACTHTTGTAPMAARPQPAQVQGQPTEDGDVVRGDDARRQAADYATAMILPPFFADACAAAQRARLWMAPEASSGLPAWIEAACPSMSVW